MKNTAGRPALKHQKKVALDVNVFNVTEMYVSKDQNGKFYFVNTLPKKFLKVSRGPQQWQILCLNKTPNTGDFQYYRREGHLTSPFRLQAKEASLLQDWTCLGI